MVEYVNQRDWPKVLDQVLPKRKIAKWKEGKPGGGGGGAGGEGTPAADAATTEDAEADGIGEEEDVLQEQDQEGGGSEEEERPAKVPRLGDKDGNDDS